MTKLSTLLIGTSGLTAVTATPELIPQNLDAASITQTIIQIVIGWLIELSLMNDQVKFIDFVLQQKPHSLQNGI